jgi:hypothetical protein
MPAPATCTPAAAHAESGPAQPSLPPGLYRCRMGGIRVACMGSRSWAQRRRAEGCKLRGVSDRSFKVLLLERCEHVGEVDKLRATHEACLRSFLSANGSFGGSFRMERAGVCFKHSAHLLIHRHGLCNIQQYDATAETCVCRSQARATHYCMDPSTRMALYAIVPKPTRRSIYAMRRREARAAKCGFASSLSSCSWIDSALAASIPSAERSRTAPSAVAPSRGASALALARCML